MTKPKSKNLPPLKLPQIERIGMIGFYQPKKSGKTSSAAICAAIFAQLGYEAEFFQNDRHERFRAFGTSTLIELATQRDVLAGRVTIDLRNNEPMYESIVGLPDHPSKLIIHDSSAPAADRVGTVFAAGGFNDLFPDRCKALLFVPFRPVIDVAEGALAMMKDLKKAMPDHFVIPIAIVNSDALDEISPNHAFWKVVDEAEYGVVTVRALAEQFAQLLERIDLPITTTANRKDKEVTRQINEILQCTTMVAGGVQMYAAALLSDYYKELFLPLGFPTGA